MDARGEAGVRTKLGHGGAETSVVGIHEVWSSIFNPIKVEYAGVWGTRGEITMTGEVKRDTLGLDSKYHRGVEQEYGTTYMWKLV